MNDERGYRLTDNTTRGFSRHYEGNQINIDRSFCIIYCIFVRDFLLACVLGSVLSGLREDTGRIDGHSGVRLIHPTDRAPGTDTRILRSEANEPPKKNEGGPINSPSGTDPERFRFRDNRQNVRNIPPRAIAMQDSRIFGRKP